jgi:hypothetical protein
VVSPLQSLRNSGRHEAFSMYIAEHAVGCGSIMDVGTLSTDRAYTRLRGADSHRKGRLFNSLTYHGQKAIIACGELIISV